MKKIKNIAIIAHVDHGKTKLVDRLLKSSGMFRSNENIDDLSMDSNTIERERGITILAKTTAIDYKEYRINSLTGEFEKIQYIPPYFNQKDEKWKN